MFIDEKKFGEFQVVDNRPFDDINRIIEWLENQPIDKSYNYCRQDTCCATKYLEECGLKGIGKQYQYIYNYPNLRKISAAREDHSSDMIRWTYGKALERAKQIRG